MINARLIPVDCWIDETTHLPHFNYTELLGKYLNWIKFSSSTKQPGKELSKN